MSKRIRRENQLAVVHPHAAGLDIGAREIWGCVPPDRDGQTVQAFGTFTPDLQRLADWLVKCEVDTVAMESTGVYTPPPMLRIGRGISGLFRQGDWVYAEDNAKMGGIDLNPFDQGADNLPAGLKVGLMQTILDFRRESV